MTADPAQAAITPPGEAVEAVLRVAQDRFVDLGYVASDGLLDLALEGSRILGIRIELPDGGRLGLQSIGITAEGADDVAAQADVRASSWHGGTAQTFEPSRLLDFDVPAGTIVQTGADRPAWVEVRFPTPLAVTRLRLRNASDDASDARGIRVSAITRWRRHTLYDGRAQLRAWGDALSRAKAAAGSDPGAIALLDVLDLTVRGDYGRAHTTLAKRVTNEGHRQWLRVALNGGLLRSRGREWTTHGPQRPFRLWSEQERVDYVRDSAAVVESLRSLTPDVCLGFGSVLSVVRDKALIPHDDDLDIIVGFEPSEASNLGDGLRLVEEHLRPLGYEVSGRFAAHRHVRRPGRKRVDVFVGIFGGDAISWYPGPRDGLTRAIVFPPGPADLLGVPCSIPAQPEAYLERVYGAGWRVPDPYFSHAWNLSAYADIAGTPAPKTPPGPGAS